MKFPPNLSKNILKTFSTGCGPENVHQNHIQVTFDEPYSIETLQELCLLSIANTWQRFPHRVSLGSEENKNYFLRELKADSDVLAVSKFVKEDIFWERQYRSVFGPRHQRTEPGKWLKVFMEKHLQVWLEKQKPSEFEEEGVVERMEVYSPFVESLVVHNFQPPPKQEIHHIPLNGILQSLTLLTHIDLSVNIKNAGDSFSDSCSNLSERDVVSLATGLETCTGLFGFRLGGTKLTPTMAKRLGVGLENCAKLKSLHMVNCNLSDQGVIAFLMGLSPSSLQEIEDLDLSNNFISSTGAFQLAIVLARRPVKSLNLRLNPIKSEGACLLLGKLFKARKLQCLNFSACSLDPTTGVMLCKVITECPSLASANLSVNSFNDQMGWSVLESLKTNSTLIHLDLRNSNLSATSAMLIDGLVKRNVLETDDDKEMQIG